MAVVEGKKQRKTIWSEKAYNACTSKKKLLHFVKNL